MSNSTHSTQSPPTVFGRRRQDGGGGGGGGGGLSLGASTTNAVCLHPRVTPEQLRNATRNYIARVALAALRSEAWPRSVRARALRRMGVKLGRDCFVSADVTIVAPRNLVLGNSVFINVGCLLEAGGGITIGDMVDLGPNVQLLTTTHEVGGPQRRALWLDRRPITVGDGAWLGAGAVVLPGVTIGPGVIVGAGSVVPSDLLANRSYAGVPARLLRELPPQHATAPVE